MGRFQYEIRLRSLETGEFLSDRIPHTSSEIAWASDSKTLFYVDRDREAA